MADGVAAAFLRRADFADIVEFDEVPAELGADGTADLAFFQFLHRAFKFGHHHAVAEPAQIAALRRAAVLRILSRQLAEITALFRLHADFVDNGFGSGYGVFFFRLNQNMLGAVLARSLTFGNGDTLLLRPCQCGIDFRLADARVLQNGLLLYFLRHQRVGGLSAQGGFAQAVFCGACIELVYADFLFGSGMGDGLVHFGLGGGQSAPFACLNDEGLVNQLRQNLLAQFVFRRPLGGRQAARLGNGLFELAHGNHAVACHGGNAVYGFNVGGGGRLKKAGQKGGG